MKYEVWDLIEMTGGELPTPFTLLFKSDDFNKVYDYFIKNINEGNKCFISINMTCIDKYKDDSKIFESPDGGNTIYERAMLENNRKKIK